MAKMYDLSNNVLENNARHFFGQLPSKSLGYYIYIDYEHISINRKVQRADLTCDVIKKRAPFVLSKL